MYTPLRILVMKIWILVSLDKYFGDTTNVNFGRLTASARPLFRALRPGYEKTTISIEFNIIQPKKLFIVLKGVSYTYWVVMFLNLLQLEFFMDF